jgi:hypothetical protein
MPDRTLLRAMPFGMNTVGIWLRESGALCVVCTVLVDPIVGGPASELLISTSRPPITFPEGKSTGARVDIVLESDQPYEHQSQKWSRTGPMTV